MASSCSVRYLVVIAIWAALHQTASSSEWMHPFHCDDPYHKAMTGSHVTDQLFGRGRAAAICYEGSAKHGRLEVPLAVVTIQEPHGNSAKVVVCAPDSMFAGKKYRLKDFDLKPPHLASDLEVHRMAEGEIIRVAPDAKGAVEFWRCSVDESAEDSIKATFHKTKETCVAEDKLSAMAIQGLKGRFCAVGKQRQIFDLLVLANGKLAICISYSSDSELRRLFPTPPKDVTSYEVFNKYQYNEVPGEEWKCSGAVATAVWTRG